MTSMGAAARVEAMRTSTAEWTWEIYTRLPIRYSIHTYETCTQQEMKMELEIS